MLLFARETPVVESHDPRIAEILELCETEHITLRTSIDVVLWLEDRGYVVDLRTGVAMKVEIAAVTRTGRTVNHLLSPAVATTTAADMEATINGLFDQADDCAPDGTLFTMIDAANEETEWYEARLQELRDAMEDDEWNRRGC